MEGQRRTGEATRKVQRRKQQKRKRKGDRHQQHQPKTEGDKPKNITSVPSEFPDIARAPGLFFPM